MPSVSYFLSKSKEGNLNFDNSNVGSTSPKSSTNFAARLSVSDSSSTLVSIFISNGSSSSSSSSSILGSSVGVFTSRALGESILEWFEIVGSRFSKGTSNADFIASFSSDTWSSTKEVEGWSSSDNSDLSSFLVRIKRRAICCGPTLKRKAIYTIKQNTNNRAVPIFPT